MRDLLRHLASQMEGEEHADDDHMDEEGDGEGGKLSHVDSLYVPTGPIPFVCAACRHYHGPDDCELVAGPIAPSASCAVWKPTSDLISMSHSEESD